MSIAVAITKSTEVKMAKPFRPRVAERSSLLVIVVVVVFSLKSEEVGETLAVATCDGRADERRTAL